MRKRKGLINPFVYNTIKSPVTLLLSYYLVNVLLYDTAQPTLYNSYIINISTLVMQQIFIRGLAYYTYEKKNRLKRDEIKPIYLFTTLKPI